MKTQLIPIIISITITILLIACTCCESSITTPDIPPPTQPVTDTTIPPTFTEFPSLIPSETAEPTETASQIPSATLLPSETPTMEPTISPTPTPTPTCITVANTNNPAGWKPNFDNSNGNLSLNALNLNQDEGVIELEYDVGPAGYSLITHNIDPKILTGADGISFFYKGQGAPNSIEFKLLLDYDGLENTCFGKTLDRASDTADKWIYVTVPFGDMACWWPDKNCDLHGDLLNTAKIDRMDFVVKNNGGDDPGSGWVRFKDVCVYHP